MSRVVSRTCTEVPDNERDREPTSRSLDAYRAAPAYVLLGDPGAGKTTAFQREREACGADGVLVSARDFLTFEPTNHPEWRGKTLFIDGLDEVRAGQPDARVPLDSIRRHLDGLGKPRFRLSCRAADWLGTNDRSNMAAVAPDGSLTVLRLDPLRSSDVGAILAVHPHVQDSDRFIREARERGVDGFLTNPQSLNMLADVVAGGNWPASRLELFEQACRRMAGEHSHEHDAGGPTSNGAPAPAGGSLLADVLEAAGRLCAIQLVAGTAGYALIRSEESRDFPAFDRCEEEWNSIPASDRGGASRSALLRTALRTKLFRASSNGRFAPVHRHIAEFLAARYLAGLIRGRESVCAPSAKRVLALIAGGDGIVVTQLRGLSAWLAAQSRDARRDLIERDPIGVGLYGDVSGFSTQEKRVLLQALERHASRLFSVPWTAAALSPFVATTMEPTFREILTGGRLRDRQSFALFVLHILTHGSGLPSLCATLLGIVRDDTLRPSVNAEALRAYVYNCSNRRDRTNELKKLLADVHGDQLSDPNEELLGILLTELYPDELSPSELWEYLSIPQNQVYLGEYRRFCRTLAERGSDSQVAESLDVLVARPEIVNAMVQSSFLRTLPGDLLARGLEAQGERIETKRLFDWLGVGLEARLRGYRQADDELRRIRFWLEAHLEIQESIYAEGLRRSARDPGQFPLRVSRAWQRLYGAAAPPGFGLWCLNQALAASDGRVARVLLASSLRAVSEGKGDRGLSLDILIDRTRHDRALAETLGELRRPDDTDRRLKERTQIARQGQEEDERNHGEWAARVREHAEALRANRGAPRLLHQLAAVYLDPLLGAEGEGPRARLRELLGDDDLVDAACVALRGATSRSDLPDADEIIRLRAKNQEHYLALPFKAGLAELDRAGRNVSPRLVDQQKRIALAFRYCGVFRDEPVWYQRLLASDPELVADVLTKYARSALRSGQDVVAGLHELARSDRHARVARVASLRILQSFPVRCATRQLVYLNYLLWSALRHADRESFASLVDHKLSRTSMNVAQRARWLAAGLVMSPEACSEAAIAFTKGSERRVREFAGFLGDWGDAPVWIGRLGTAGLEMLVRMIGASFGPRTWASGEATRVIPTMEAPDHVEEMIKRLAESPTDAAGAALRVLASEESLSRWRDELVQARDRQRVIHRDAVYRHPEVEHVCRTLSDGPPANAGDLAALVQERLREIRVDLRSGNDNGWRLYWNEGEYREPVEPKYEDSCRDALLRDLRPRLPHEVDAQPEGRYAHDTRADIRVACNDFHVPLEIKRHYHPKLWTAARDQLIAKYTSNPATGGYGIYLVLWFGETKAPRTPPSSRSRPDGPDALKARLEEELTTDEARRISICVLDVSPPPPAGAALSDRTSSSESAP